MNVANDVILTTWPIGRLSLCLLMTLTSIYMVRSIQSEVERLFKWQLTLTAMFRYVNIRTFEARYLNLI